MSFETNKKWKARIYVKFKKFFDKLAPKPYSKDYMIEYSQKSRKYKVIEFIYS